MPEIAPIETVFNGHRFRSRLEARWAVWLTEMGIRYEYEPEGYDLGKGVWYLPDFWVEEWESFVEIKPLRELHAFDPTVSKEENLRRLKLVEDRELARSKCEVLCDLLKKQVLMIEGNPWPGEYRIYAAWRKVGSEDNLCDWESGLIFGECRRCPTIFLMQMEGNYPLVGWAISKGYADCRGCTDRAPLAESERLNRAFTAARQERFS